MTEIIPILIMIVINSIYVIYLFHRTRKLEKEHQKDIERIKRIREAMIKRDQENGVLCGCGYDRKRFDKFFKE